MVKLTPRRRWRGPALGGRLIWFDYHALVSKRMELAVTCEATLLRHFRPLVDRRQSQFRSARQHGLPIEEEQRRCQDVESLNARNTRLVHSRCDLFRGGCGKDQKLHVTRARPLFQTLQVLGSGDVGIGECGDPANARHHLHDEVLPLAVELRREQAHAVLPPGRRIDGTKPSPTMSSLAASIGMVFVAAWAARAAIGPAATIASGAALTSAAATSPSNSLRTPNLPEMTVRFWPSTKPRPRSSSKNAVYHASSRGAADTNPMR